jgi:hypothetical protein
LSLSALMVERLIDGAYATIQNSFHAWLSCPLGCRPRGDVSADASLASAVGKAKVFLVPPSFSLAGSKHVSLTRLPSSCRTLWELVQTSMEWPQLSN